MLLTARLSLGCRIPKKEWLITHVWCLLVDTAGHLGIDELLFSFLRDKYPYCSLSIERSLFICHDLFCFQSYDPYQRYSPIGFYYQNGAGL